MSCERDDCCQGCVPGCKEGMVSFRTELEALLEKHDVSLMPDSEGTPVFLGPDGLCWVVTTDYFMDQPE